MPNANGNKKIWIAVGVALFAGFLSFTAHRVFIYTPECYATKQEMREFKQEMREIKQEMSQQYRYIIDRLDRILERDGH